MHCVESLKWSWPPIWVLSSDFELLWKIFLQMWQCWKYQQLLSVKLQIWNERMAEGESETCAKKDPRKVSQNDNKPWKDEIKEVLVQENQWRQIGLKTKALVKGKKSLHQLQVKIECVGSFLFHDDMMIALWLYDNRHMRIWWHWHAARIISWQKTYGLYGQSVWYKTSYCSKNILLRRVEFFFEPNSHWFWQICENLKYEWWFRVESGVMERSEDGQMKIGLLSQWTVGRLSFAIWYTEQLVQQTNKCKQG